MKQRCLGNNMVLFPLLGLLVVGAIANDEEIPVSLIQKQLIHETENEMENSSRELIVGYCHRSRGDWIWNDKDSGSDVDAAAYRPPKRSGYTPIGDLFQNKWGVSPFTGDLPIFKTDGDVVPPMDFDFIWSDKGSGGKYDISVWRPRARPGYICPADAVTNGQKPNARDYVCLPTKCLKQVTIKNKIWDDRGSGADKDFTAFQSPIHKGYFIGVAKHASSTSGYTLSEECGGVIPLSVEICTVQRARATKGKLTFDEESGEGSYSDRQYSETTKKHFATQMSASATYRTGLSTYKASMAAQASFDSMVSEATRETRNSFSKTKIKFECEGPCFIYQVRMTYHLSDGGSFEQLSSLQQLTVQWTKPCQTIKIEG